VTCLLVDGNNLFWRSALAKSTAGMTRKSDGMPTGATVAFIRTMLHLTYQHAVHYGAVIFDSPQPSFRQFLNPAYKASREHAMAPEAAEQLPLIRYAAECLGFLLVDSGHYEADDIIATYANKSQNRTVIVSDDKDLGALVAGQRITQHRLCDMKDGKPAPEIDAFAVKARWGVEPHLVSDVLCLCGDSVDEVAGLNGVGPVLASDAIRRFGSVEKVALCAIEWGSKYWRRRASAMADVNRMIAMTRLVHDADVPHLPTSRPAAWLSKTAALLLALEATATARALAKRHRLDLRRIRPDPKHSSKSSASVGRASALFPKAKS
jgi:DNA polymerase-1